MRILIDIPDEYATGSNIQDEINDFWDDYCYQCY